MHTNNYHNLGLGVGLRSQHYQYLLENNHNVDFFEIISENYIDNYGVGREVIAHLRQDSPFVMHGVSLSIGSTDPINFHYLDKLIELADFVQPEWISDHLCWTGIAGINTHDLLPLPLPLPLPLTEETFKHVKERILTIQDYLKRPLIIENPSTYLQFNASEIKEYEFLTALYKSTDCGILLDVNNVYVSAHNHNFDAIEYVKNLPHHAIAQVHLAGPTRYGHLLIDTHDQPVPKEVWELYMLVHQLTGGVSTLLEWDANIPDFTQLVDELFLAKKVIKGTMPNIVINDSDQAFNSNPTTYSFQSLKQ